MIQKVECMATCARTTSLKIQLLFRTWFSGQAFSSLLRDFMRTNGEHKTICICQPESDQPALSLLGSGYTIFFLSFKRVTVLDKFLLWLDRDNVGCRPIIACCGLLTACVRHKGNRSHCSPVSTNIISPSLCHVYCCIWKNVEERHRNTLLFLCCFDFLPLHGIKQAFVAPNEHFCSHVCLVGPLLGWYRVSTLSPNNVNVSIEEFYWIMFSDGLTSSANAFQILSSCDIREWQLWLW